jgi:hypothetical protein
MRSLFRLFVTVLLLGTTMQLGWLQAAIGFVTEHLGGPGAVTDPLPRVDATGLLRRLGEAVAGLPDPWYSLALMIGGIVALILAAAVINGLVRAKLRLTGWLRDASV